VDDVDRASEVARPAARYRLERVQEALALTRRGLEPGAAAVRFFVDITVGKLAELPVDQWCVEIDRMMEALEAEASQSEYGEFLTQLQAQVEERLAEGQKGIRVESVKRELADLQARIVFLEDAVREGLAPALGTVIPTARRWKLRRLRRHAARIETALGKLGCDAREVQG
jgi:hypothetical protein